MWMKIWSCRVRYLVLYQLWFSMDHHLWWYRCSKSLWGLFLFWFIISVRNQVELFGTRVRMCGGRTHNGTPGLYHWTISPSQSLYRTIMKIAHCLGCLRWGSVGLICSEWISVLAAARLCLREGNSLLAASFTLTAPGSGAKKVGSGISLLAEFGETSMSLS